MTGDDEARKRCFATLVAHTVPDAGHMLHHDQPGLCVGDRGIFAFVAELRSARAAGC